MNYTSPDEALRVLGLDGSATREDIKTAYHKLASVFHPDASDNPEPDSGDAFIMIRSAYEYLMQEYDRVLSQYMNAAAAAAPRPEVSPIQSAPAPKIIGSAKAMETAAANRHFAREKLAQERRLEKARKERQKEIDRRLDNYKADLEYETAMKKIHAIRAAEITLMLYEASLKGTLGNIGNNSEES